MVIPPCYREQILDDLHDQHPGMCRMKALARSYLWWPKLDQDIEVKVRGCGVCQSVQKGPPVAPLAKRVEKRQENQVKYTRRIIDVRENCESIKWCGFGISMEGRKNGYLEP